MVVVNKRQVEPGTAAGIDDTAITVDPNAAADATNLAVDGQAPTSLKRPRPSLKPYATSSQAEAVSASGKNISLSTVVGSCVAAIGATQRRSRRRTGGDPSRGQLSPITGAPAKGATPNLGSSRFRRIRDKWDGKEGASATAPSNRKLPDHLTVPPLEKMDMFKKSPTPQGAGSAGPARSRTSQRLGQIDSGPPSRGLPHRAKTSSSALLRIESGAMSPTFGMAILLHRPTEVPSPIAGIRRSRHLPEGQSAEYVDDNRASRTSLHNPFFSGGGSDHYPAKRARSTSQTAPRSRSNSQSTARSRSNSNATITQQPALSTPAMPVPDIVMPQYTDDNRLSMDPFNDPLPVPPTFARHQATGSASSAASNERAIRQLVAAAGIDLNEDEVQRRLKAVSMQPSVISNSGDSMYTDADPDLAEEALKSFPQPPGSTSSHGASSRF
ncbi:hypothetical protein BKA70DRAFT_1524916 [Coprinopsis sp. MPI-PUGE-AT-0042]|nr:hypothetical protein BKA70DRAFT_1524916 [Coprinopsis sp. MPI-PUGE-AT-0042]